MVIWLPNSKNSTIIPMKKSLLIAAALVVASIGVQAQTSYYNVKLKGVESTFDIMYPLATGNNATKILDKPNNDVLTSAQTVPFSFSIFGNAFTSYKASDNGYITFDGAASTSDATPATLPDATKPNNAIFGFWGDWELKAAPNAAFPVGIYSYTSGTSPNRIHVIEWFGVSRKGVAIAANADVITFAIRLHENGGLDIVNGYYGGNSFKGSIGLQDAGTNGSQVSGSPTLTFSVANTNAAKDIISYVFKSGTQPAYDATASSLQLLTFYGKNTPITLKGEIINLGATALTSFNLNYQIAGGAVVTQAVSGVNIAGSGAGTYNYAHTTPYTPTTVGAFGVEVWASDFNGSNADSDPSNDKISGTINVVDKTVPRVTLHEIFTSSTCGPCVAGNANQKAIVDGKTAGTYATVKYQQDFPGTGDPYATTETVGRRNYYAINSIPRMEIDGGWDGNANSLTDAIFDQYQEIPSAVELKATYHVGGQSVGIDVTATSYLDLPTTTKLYVAIMEKTTSQNVKTNGETEFEHVVKKMYPNQNGTVMSSLKANNPVDFNKMYTFPGSYRLAANGQSPINLSNENSVEEFTDLEVVVWLQNTATKEIYQAANAVSWNTGIAKTDASKTLGVYPNPANASAVVNFEMKSEGMVKIEIVNMLGQVVSVQESKTLAPGAQTFEINTSNIDNGAYMINVINQGFKVTKPVVIAH